MKKINRLFIKSNILLLMLLFVLYANASTRRFAPLAATDFNYNIENEVQISDKIIEFDLYLINVNTSVPFELATIQAGIFINPAIINGGTITASLIAGNSDLTNTSQIPTSTTFTSASNIIKIAAKAPPGTGNGSIISTIAPGTRICKVRLTNTNAFTANSTADLTFSYSINPYATKVFQYINGLNTELTCSNSNCFVNAPNIILNKPITAQTVTGSGSYCQGGTGVAVGLSSSEVGVTYTLYKDAVATTTTAIGTGSAISFGNQTSGVYTVKASYVNGVNVWGTTDMTGNATVVENQLPAPTISGLASICAGTTGVIYSTESGMTAYDWLVTGGTITDGSSTNQITVTWDTEGEQTVSVNYNNASNCAATTATVKNITVKGIPAAAGTITGETSVCNGTLAVAYSVPAITNATGYVWSLPTGASIASGTNTNSITVNYDLVNAVSGDISVYGTNLCNNGTANTLAVTVNPIPATPVASEVGGSAVSNVALGNQWYFSTSAGGAGDAILDATGQSYTPTLPSQTGYYWTTVTLSGCSSAISNKVYIQVVGTGLDKNGKIDVKIYSQDKNIFVYCSDKVDQIKVYNPVGSMIKIIDKTSDIHKINMTGNPDGCYIVSLISGEQVYSGKVILK